MHVVLGFELTCTERFFNGVQIRGVGWEIENEAS